MSAVILLCGIHFNASLCTLYSVTCNLCRLGKVDLQFKYIINIP